MVERLLPRDLGQMGVNRKPAAEDRLYPAEKIADDRARPHGDAAHHPKVLDDPIAGDFIGGRNDHRECPAAPSKARRIGDAGGLERERKRGRNWILFCLIERGQLVEKTGQPGNSLMAR
jgi:hypothetical protein